MRSSRTAFGARLSHDWPKIVVRIFGVLHLILVAIGVYLFSTGISLAVFSKPSDPFSEYPYEMQAYVLRTAANLVFLVTLLAAAVLLLRLRYLGVVLSNVLFIAMIVYLLDPFSFFLGEGFARSMAVTAGINAPMMPVLYTGYPVVSLIVLNLAGRRLKRLQPTEQTPVGAPPFAV